MEALKKIMMMLSFVFSAICFIASAWMAYSLPKESNDTTIFVVFAVVFLGATVWFGNNTYNLFKKDK